VIKVNFNDGENSFTYEGDAMGFQMPYEQEIKGYLRDNYNDSANLANFVLKGGDETYAEYEIEVIAKEPPLPPEPAPKAPAPKGKGAKPSSEESLLKQREITAKAEAKRFEVELKLIKELKSLGFTKAEIKKRLNQK
jgi:hypothetical protein